jgi:hypothetical protein
MLLQAPESMAVLAAAETSHSVAEPVVKWWPHRFGLGCILIGSEAGLQGTWAREISTHEEERDV